MARGKLLRTKVKEKKALIKAELQATKEWFQRKSNFPYLLKKGLFDALKRIDPLEMVAVGALTVVIQPLVASSTDIMQKLSPGVGQLPWTYMGVWELLGLIRGSEEQPEDAEPTIIMSWLLSFVIAFIIVRHPEVMTEMFSGATKLLGFAVGLLS